MTTPNLSPECEAMREELADILMSDAVEMTDATGRNYALVEADAILAAGYRKVEAGE